MLCQRPGQITNALTDGAAPLPKGPRGGLRRRGGQPLTDGLGKASVPFATPTGAPITPERRPGGGYQTWPSTGGFGYFVTILGHSDSAAIRRQMGRAGATMYGSGGLVVLGTAALPAWPGRHSLILVGLGLLSVVAGLVLRITEGKLPPAAYNPFAAAGTLVIGGLVLAGGSARAPSIYAYLYIWVVVYAVYFFPRSLALGHLALVVVTFGAIRLGHRPTWIGLGGWLTMTVTLVVAAGVVSLLADGLRTAARSDSLTGLANRQALEEALGQEMSRCRRRPERDLCIALIDIDDFKSVNDRHGHHGGDLLLRELSGAWTACLRGSDLLARLEPDSRALLARYGGDEFAVLLASCDPENARRVLDRLCSARPDATFSAGIASWDGQESAPEVIARADEALYSAKRAGRNRVMVLPSPGGGGG